MAKKKHAYYVNANESTVRKQDGTPLKAGNLKDGQEFTVEFRQSGISQFIKDMEGENCD